MTRAAAAAVASEARPVALPAARRAAPGATPGGAPLTPSTDADRQALEQAATDGADPVESAGRGHSRKRTQRGSPTLLVLLILIAAGAVAALAPQLRRLAVVRRVIPGRSG